LFAISTNCYFANLIAAPDQQCRTVHIMKIAQLPDYSGRIRCRMKFVHEDMRTLRQLIYVDALARHARTSRRIPNRLRLLTARAACLASLSSPLGPAVLALPSWSGGVTQALGRTARLAPSASIQRDPVEPDDPVQGEKYLRSSAPPTAVVSQ
jgi:hypothetical protein